MSDAYDQTLYPGGCVRQGHVNHMACIGALHGLPVAAPQRARVLELGCAVGGNLLAMAVATPDARFVGVDLSGEQIKAARSRAAALGLGNVQFVQSDLSTLPAVYSDYDYIICHGVYSWVSETVQSHIVRICNERLKPAGLAYVSYNSLPGWRLRQVVRELIQYHAAGFASPEQRVQQARAIVRLAAQSAVDTGDAFSLLLRQMDEELSAQSDGYIFHAYFSEHHEALYLSEFSRRIQVEGLEVLTDANLPAVSVHAFPPQTAALLTQLGAAGPGSQRTEQYMDFMRDRGLRRSVLCRQDLAARGGAAAEHLEGLGIRAALSAAELEQLFATEELSLNQQRARELLRRVGASLGAQPASLLCEGDSELMQIAFSCVRRGLLGLWWGDTPWAAELGVAPVGSPLARAQAAEGPMVSSLMHRDLILSEPERALLMRLDGDRTRDQLAADDPEGRVIESLLSKGLICRDSSVEPAG